MRLPRWLCDWEFQPLYCRLCQKHVPLNHVAHHVLEKDARLQRVKRDVEVYCRACGSLIYVHSEKNAGPVWESRLLIRKLAKHFPHCLVEPASGWSEEAERLINGFLLERLFGPKDGLRVSLNLLRKTASAEGDMYLSGSHPSSRKDK